MRDKIKLFVFNMIEKYYAVCMSLIIIIVLFFSCDAFPMNKTLERAKPYLNFLKETINNYWKDAPMREIIPAQIEQESLWKVKAELKTTREYGMGLSQITIAYNKDGTERFNNFINATNKYKELKNWKWEDRFNSKYHMIFSVLEDKALFKINSRLFKKNTDIWAGSLVSYNAGYGTVLKRRALCKVTNNCDYNKWFDGLDSVAMKFEKRKLYGRSLAEMRNEYPYKIIYIRSKKYVGLV